VVWSPGKTSIRQIALAFRSSCRAEYIRREVLLVAVISEVDRAFEAKNKMERKKLVCLASKGVWVNAKIAALVVVAEHEQ
jgi:hypothetical protein